MAKQPDEKKQKETELKKLVAKLRKADELHAKNKKLKKEAADAWNERLALLAEAKETMGIAEMRTCKYEMKDGEPRLAYHKSERSAKLISAALFIEWLNGFGDDPENYRGWVTQSISKLFRDLDDEEMPLPAGLEFKTGDVLQTRKSN